MSTRHALPATVLPDAGQPQKNPFPMREGVLQRAAPALAGRPSGRPADSEGHAHPGEERADIFHVIPFDEAVAGKRRRTVPKTVSDTDSPGRAFDAIFIALPVGDPDAAGAIAVIELDVLAFGTGIFVLTPRDRDSGPRRELDGTGNGEDILAGTVVSGVAERRS